MGEYKVVDRSQMVVAEIQMRQLFELAIDDGTNREYLIAVDAQPLQQRPLACLQRTDLDYFVAPLIAQYLRLENPSLSSFREGILACTNGYISLMWLPSDYAQLT